MDLTAKQFTPQAFSEVSETRDRLPVQMINNKHELFHKPFDWELKNGTWLPVLSPMPFMASLNNYDMDGVKDCENVRQIFRNKGCACIPNGDQRLGKWANYMATVDAYNPEMNSVGKYWITIFDSPIMVGNRVKWSRDEKAYDAFRQLLVDVGICTLNATIAGMVIDRKVESLTSMHQVPVTSKSKQTAIELLEKDIAAMRASLQGLEQPVPAAQPKRRRFASTPATEDDS
jgi:hypothetical protein